MIEIENANIEESNLESAMLETEHVKKQLRSARCELRQTRKEKEEVTEQLDEVRWNYSRMLKQRDNVLQKLHASEIEKKSLNRRIMCMKEAKKSKDAKIFELKHKNAVLFRSERKFKKQAQEFQKALNAVFDVSDINTSELSSSDTPPELEVVCAKAQEKPEKTALSEQSDAEQPCSPRRKNNQPSASKWKQKGTPTRPKKRANTSTRLSRRARPSPKRTRK